MLIFGNWLDCILEGFKLLKKICYYFYIYSLIKGTDGVQKGAGRGRREGLIIPPPAIPD